jgi:hypothetical protein
MLILNPLFFNSKYGIAIPLNLFLILQESLSYDQYTVNVNRLNIQMKLKQKIALGLCAFYLISVIGVALSLHFCGGTLSSVHFTRTAQCKGCKAVKETAAAKKCCKNTNVDAKIKDSHASGSGVNLPKNFSIPLFLFPTLSNILEKVLPKLFSKIENKAPPFSARFSLYAYNCIFRN